MRIVYIDIDTLRPDHLGCYGYHRDTSPNIDRVAREGTRFENCYVPDAPCLPSRAALHHGRFGIHNGAINHGGAHADPYNEGASRGFHNSDDYLQWVGVLKENGFHNATVSSFAWRHHSWWFLAGFHEVYDCGKGGSEIATEVTEKALEFVERNKENDNWFLHFNNWDPHTPYRVPDEYGNPFADSPIASWVTQEMIDAQQNTYGTHSANATLHNPEGTPTSREVARITNLDDYKQWIDGYDVGIKFADDAVGRVLSKLEEAGLYEDTAIIISSDHGENQGELNVYGDHQTADRITCRVPMILKWPGQAPRVDAGFHYQFDVAATILELVGAEVPAKWDAVSFKDAFLEGRDEGRDYLVVSQAAWSCQRSVVFDDFLLIRTYHDGLKDFPPVMLFDITNDPHELQNLADSRPDLVNRGLALLQQWMDEQMLTADVKEDPMMNVIEEGGPFHTRGRLELYLNYYRKIGRADIAERMERKYAGVPGASERDWSGALRN